MTANIPKQLTAGNEIETQTHLLMTESTDQEIASLNRENNAIITPNSWLRQGVQQITQRTVLLIVTTPKQHSIKNLATKVKSNTANTNVDYDSCTCQRSTAFFVYMPFNFYGNNI